MSWSKRISGNLHYGKSYYDQPITLNEAYQLSKIPTDFKQGLLLDKLENVIFGNIEVSGVLDGVVIRNCNNLYINSLYVHTVAGDFVNIQSSFANSNITINKLVIRNHLGCLPYSVRHPDAVQFNHLDGAPILSHFTINDISIKSNSPIQGIGDFDGIMQYLNLGRTSLEIAINTDQHGLSFLALQHSKIGAGHVYSPSPKGKAGIILQDRKGLGIHSFGNKISKDLHCESWNIESPMIG